MASSETTKTRRIEIRITEEERNLEQAAAAVSGETLSEFVRRAARYEAERTLAERTRHVVNDEAAQQFLGALEQPFPASERGLRRLNREAKRPTRRVTPQLSATADVRLSTLNRYVEALGGRLEVRAAFPQETVALRIGKTTVRRRRTQAGSPAVVKTARNPRAKRARKTATPSDA